MSLGTVAVFNSNDDVVDLLRMAFEQAGFVTVTGHVHDIRDGKLDVASFVRQHNPQVIVYDLMPPYESSWNFLNHLREREPLRGRQFVLTSTNPVRVKELTRTTEQVWEVVGRPLDLDQIVGAVREAMKARPVRD